MHYVDATLDKCFPNLNIKPNLARVSFGLAILWIAVLSRILVESGVIIAHAFGIPEVVIGLTILAA